MTLTDFNKLNTIQKSDMVWEWGYFITKNKYEDFTIAIFYMTGFYIKMRISIKDNKTEDVLGLTKEQLQNEFPSVLNTRNVFVTSL